MARKEKKSSDGDAKSTDVKGQIHKCSSYFIFLFFLKKRPLQRFACDWIQPARKLNQHSKCRNKCNIILGNRLGWTNVGRIKTKTFPLVMGALGTIKKDMENYSNKIPGNINIYELQKITLLSSAHLLWRVLSIKQKPVCLPKSMVWTRSWERKSTTNTVAYISFIQLFRERLSNKVHATTAKCIVGGLEFTVFQRNLKEW